MKINERQIRRFERYIVRGLSRVWTYWPARAEVRKRAFVRKEGKVEYSRCESCQGIFRRDETAVDHIDPVVPLRGPKRLKDGWLDLNVRRTRLLILDSTLLRNLCKACHKTKSSWEMTERAKFRRRKKEKKQ